MNRVLLIGNTGAGKTTFARKLAAKQNLPLIHLDQLYWRGDWEHLSREEFDAALQIELEKPRWIMDGNFDRTIPHRLQYCDAVIFLDYSTITCLAGITRRIFSNLGKVRPDMGGNCVEHFDFQKLALYRSTLRFRQKRDRYYELLNKQTGIKVIIFRNRRQANAFLEKL